MISVEEALERIAAGFTPLAAESVALSNAAGRVLAEDARARLSQPPADMSAMDGYAIRFADVARVPARLGVVGVAPAGGAYGKKLQPGEAVRIFTGGPLPEGADTVVMQENTDLGEKTVTIKEMPLAGRHIRRAGLDFVAGKVGIAAGTRLSPRHISLAASMNLPWLNVHRRPRVAILATGDELVRAGEPIGPNQIVASSGLGLAAMLRAWGADVTDLGIARDHRSQLKAALQAAQGFDLLVTLGGASVGDHDLVQAVLVEIGFKLDFWKIAMRPGKPIMFGTWARGESQPMPVFGLPGNPVSALVCALLFVRAAVLRLTGLSDIALPRAGAALGADLPANDTRQDYLRADLSGRGGGKLIATALTVQDSSMMSALARAGALIVRAPHAPAAKAGESVEIIPFEALGGGF